MAASRAVRATLDLKTLLGRLGASPASVLVAVLLPASAAADAAAGSKLVEAAVENSVRDIISGSSAGGGAGASPKEVRLTMMPLVLGAQLARKVLGAARVVGAAESASHSACFHIPLGAVEAAFAGAQSAARASAVRVAVGLSLPQSVACRPDASGESVRAFTADALASHDAVVFAFPPGALPMPPSGEELLAAAAELCGPPACVGGIRAALEAHLRVEGGFDVGTVEYGAPAAEGDAPWMLPAEALDAMPASATGSVDHVVIGGTFDRLHAGHWKLIAAAAALAGRRLTIGVTSDAMIASKEGAEQIQPEAVRAEAAKAAALAVAPGLEVRCPLISDPMGPSATDETMGAIVVSSETARGADAINRARFAAGLGLLRPFVVSRLGAAGLSSTELRRLDRS
ncbi:hypothetical protein FNF31_05965 [Cafeteria roenbergensis]|uniref:Cytidyltransferase-like domain-containing protein n=1 Tax=Cafeteria roenbergensis TaxID=33653 RepID=A0A5A8CSV0_CAFRO|nr:hypothetical protein FNF31_05965 [Cafeteria roenbergensis]